MDAAVSVAAVSWDGAPPELFHQPLHCGNRAGRTRSEDEAFDRSSGQVEIEPTCLPRHADGLVRSDHQCRCGGIEKRMQPCAVGRAGRRNHAGADLFDSPCENESAGQRTVMMERDMDGATRSHPGAPQSVTPELSSVSGAQLRGDRPSVQGTAAHSARESSGTRWRSPMLRSCSGTKPAEAKERACRGLPAMARSHNARNRASCNAASSPRPNVSVLGFQYGELVPTNKPPGH